VNKKHLSTTITLIIGAALIVLGAIPSIFAYPYSDGPNSGPSNTWELTLMIAYEGWIWFLIIGLVLSVFSLLYEDYKNRVTRWINCIIKLTSPIVNYQ
jgi:hypothetical protein